MFNWIVQYSLRNRLFVLALALGVLYFGITVVLPALLEPVTPR